MTETCGMCHRTKHGKFYRAEVHAEYWCSRCVNKHCMTPVIIKMCGAISAQWTEDGIVMLFSNGDVQLRYPLDE